MVRMFKFVYTKQASDYGLGRLSVIDLSTPKGEHYCVYNIYIYMLSHTRRRVRVRYDV